MVVLDRCGSNDMTIIILNKNPEKIKENAKNNQICVTCDFQKYVINISIFV